MYLKWYRKLRFQYLQVCVRHPACAPSSTESFCGARPRFCSFFFSILGWRVRFKRMEKAGRNVGDFIDCRQERGFVCLRGFVKTADFSYELQCGSSGFFRGYGRIEVEEGFDIPAHLL